MPCRKALRAQSRLLRDLRPEHPAKADGTGRGKGPIKRSVTCLVAAGTAGAGRTGSVQRRTAPVGGRAGGTFQLGAGGGCENVRIEEVGGAWGRGSGQRDT